MTSRRPGTRAAGEARPQRRRLGGKILDDARKDAYERLAHHRRRERTVGGTPGHACRHEPGEPVRDARSYRTQRDRVGPQPGQCGGRL